MRAYAALAWLARIVPILISQLMERVAGIEPARPAWKAGVLPLNYTRLQETDPISEGMIPNEAPFNSIALISIRLRKFSDSLHPASPLIGGGGWI